MKVTLFVASQVNRGTFFRAFFLAKYLSRRGHDITLILSGERATTLSYEMSDGFRVIALPYANHLLTYLPVQIAAATLSCIRQLIDSSDVVHIFQIAVPSTWLTALFEGSTGFVGRKRRLFFDWDDLWGSGGVLVDYGRVISFIGSLMEEKFLRLADGVTVASEYLREKARKAGAKKVRFIPNGTERDSQSRPSKIRARESLGIKKDGVVLCHVGFVDLGSVWSKIAWANPEACLLYTSPSPRDLSTSRMPSSA